MIDTPETTDAPAEDNIKITTAFMVAIDDKGHVYVERDTSALAIPVERDATLIEVRRYLSEILMDLQAQAAAEYVAVRLAPPPPAAE